MKSSENRTRRMRPRNLLLAAIFGLAAMIVINACGDGSDDGSTTDDDTTNTSDDTMAVAETAADFAWANALGSPPPGYNGPVFQLSHNYPSAMPDHPASLYPWLEMDVSFDETSVSWGPEWNDYIMSVLDYIRQGQNEMITNEAGFDVNVDGSTRWFHMPWMAYDNNVGREFAHGCTSERVAVLSDFLGDDADGGVRNLHTLPGIEASSARFETWAFGVYNDYGGYSIGQAVPPSGVPAVTTNSAGQTVPVGLPFPERTVVAKMLFTTANPVEVYYLKNSPEWMVNRHQQTSDSTFNNCVRELQPVYLVQLDIAVTDPRSPSNWVFGTFAYDGTIDAASPWDRMVPVGLQWGGDPLTFPAVPADQSVPAHQSVLNQLNIYEHYGCNGRLAGPVDNKMASCMSCHGGSYAGPMDTLTVMGTNVPPIFGFDSICDYYTKTNVDYFQTEKFPEPYPGGDYPDAIPLDFSLQLQVAFEQWQIFQNGGGRAPCSN